MGIEDTPAGPIWHYPGESVSSFLGEQVHRSPPD
jgi:hypothetical protein